MNDSCEWFSVHPERRHIVHVCKISFDSHQFRGSYFKIVKRLMFLWTQYAVYRSAGLYDPVNLPITAIASRLTLRS